MFHVNVDVFIESHLVDLEVHFHFVEVLAVFGILAVTFKVEADAHVKCIHLAVCAYVGDEVD